MAGFNYVFDAAQYAPEQAASAHPVGKFPAVVSKTEIKPTADGTGGMFAVEFTTNEGRISTRYNLWNQNAKAVEIAHKQLSALSHATGVFKIDMNNEGAALVNARCMIEVGKQKDSDYVEVKRVYDASGFEPGKAPQNQGAAFGQQPVGQPLTPAQGNPTPPQTAPAANAWGAPNPVQQPQQQAPQPTQPAWGAPAPQNAAPATGQPAWSQQQAAAHGTGDKPPWVS